MATASQYRELLASSPTLRNFLNLIGWVEGANYNIGFGNRTFNNFAWHPYQQSQFRIVDPVTKRPSTTSAAGKYQYQRGTWDRVARALGLKDFSPANQDIGAVKLLHDRGVLQDVLNGNIAKAVVNLRQEWQGFDVKPLNTVLAKWNSMAGDSKYQLPSASVGTITAQPAAEFKQYMGVEVFGAKNRYLIAFAILVIIFIFAFN